MNKSYEEITNWINIRKEENQKPYKVMFQITVPKIIEDFHKNPVLNKIKNIFLKYGVKMNIIDTVSGAYNLNRDWYETTTETDCYVEYCGVYPINWDIKDVVELERMDKDGEVIIMAYWNVDGKYIPNN